MATGYTSIIEEKENVSFREFALRCSRAFGALIELRDEPMDARIPTKFKPSSYHKDAFKEACKKFYSYIRIRNDEADKLANEIYVSQLESDLKYIQKSKQLAVKYGEMLGKVATWKSPSEEHDNYRNFMISQLEESLEHDCGYNSDTPKKMSGPEYRTMLVEQARRDMDYHKKEFAEEVKRAKGRTE